MDLGWGALWGKPATNTITGQPPAVPDYSSVKWNLGSNYQKPERMGQANRKVYQSETCMALWLKGLLVEQSQVCSQAVTSGHATKEQW